jgi:hypothetical protein
MCVNNDCTDEMESTWCVGWLTSREASHKVQCRKTQCSKRGSDEGGERRRQHLDLKQAYGALPVVQDLH